MHLGCLRRIAPLLLALPAISLAQQVAIGEYVLPTADSYPNDITTGPDGALWFTETSNIGRISTAGAITQYPQTGGPWGIVTGPDAALWFTLASSARIGRMTTHGILTASYPVPTPHSNPYGITAGPDGALWFAEYVGSKIGRMTTTGVGTEYPVASTYRGPVSITPGPDGALWFTEFNGNRIGRITTAGAITGYVVPTPYCSPDWITAGPDGALWFTEAIGNKIGRITTAGSITEFPVPTAGSQPTGIAPGPDGALWFTESVGNQIGRITTAGAITEYAVPTAGSYPYQIAAGPDGGLWFTESHGNKIGEIVLPTAGLSVSPPSGFFQAGLTFTGNGYAAGENVSIYIGGVGSPVLANATADSGGSFTVTARAPQSPYGPRIFLGTGRASGKIGAANFSVTPRLILDPDAGPPGSTTAVSGYGFGSFEEVDIYWDDPPAKVGTGIADIHGTFDGTAAVTIKVPKQAPAGIATVSGAGELSGAHGGGEFTVE
jgi:streptogramin lyase